jgi:hypothetical protein
MRALWIVGLALLATACGKDKPSPAEQARQDAADVAAVNAAQVPPATPVTPETVGAPDIEKYDMYGVGCSFAAGTSMAPVVLAQPKRAYMKIDGDIVPFAPDAGSADLPLGTKAKYTASAWSFIFDIASEEGKQSGTETINYPARLILRNDHDQIVFQSDGTAQCGS